MKTKMKTLSMISFVLILGVVLSVPGVIAWYDSDWSNDFDFVDNVIAIDGFAERQIAFAVPGFSTAETTIILDEDDCFDGLGWWDFDLAGDDFLSSNRAISLDDDEFASALNVVALDDDDFLSSENIIALDSDEFLSRNRNILLEGDDFLSNDRIIELDNGFFNFW